MSWRKLEDATLQYLKSCGIEIRDAAGNPTIKIVRRYVPVGDEVCDRRRLLRRWRLVKHLIPPEGER